MIDKIFDLGETDGARGDGPAGGRGRAARHRAARRRACGSSPSAASRAFPSSPTARSTSWASSPPWICFGGAPQAPDLALAHAPRHLRPGDQAHRRPPPRDAEGAPAARGGGGRVRRRGRHRHRRGHRRGDRGRDPGRARPDSRHASSACPTAATAWRGATSIDELNEALDWELPKGDFETVAGSCSPPSTASPRSARCSGSGATRSPCSRPTGAASSRSASPRQGSPTKPAPTRTKEEPDDGRHDGRVPDQRAHDEGLSRDPRRRQGPGRARDPGVVGPRGPHQERVRPLRGRRLLGPRARHVPRQDGERARRGGQALHGAEHRAGREGSRRAPRSTSPATPRRPSSGAVGFCMGGQLALFAGCTPTRASARWWTSTASTRT